MNKYLNTNKLDTSRGRNEAYVNRVGKALNNYASPNEYIIKRAALAPNIDTFVANLNSLKFNLSEFNQLKNKLLAYININTGSEETPTHVLFIKTSYNIFTGNVEELILHNYSYSGSIINLVIKNINGTISVSAHRYTYLGGDYTDKVDDDLINLNNKYGALDTKVTNHATDITNLKIQIDAIKNSIGTGGGDDDGVSDSIVTTIINLSNELASHKTESNNKHTELDTEVSDLSNRIYSLEQLIGTGGGSGNVNLSTLAGAVIKFNSDLAFLDGVTELNMLFSNGEITYSKISIIYNEEGNFYVMKYDNKDVYVEDVNEGTAIWIKDEYRTIRITTGDDVNNPTKVAWALGNSNVISSGSSSTGGIDTSVFVTVDSLNTKLADYAKTSVTNSIQNQVKTINDNYIKSISYTEGSGIFTFVVQKDGVEKTVPIDLAIEKVVANFTYNQETEQLELTLADGSIQYVALSALVVDGYTKLEVDNKVNELRGLINNIDAYSKGESDDKYATRIFQEEATLRMGNIETTIGAQDKTLANLQISVTNAQNNISDNAALINSTQTRVTINEEDIVVLEDKVAALESVAESIEEATIPSSAWAALRDASPYTYSTTITLSSLTVNSISLELVNDQPIIFATYGFAIASVSGSNAVIYSIGIPTSDVKLTFYVGGAETTKLITFTINGTSYNAEEGMTWEEWCNSEYNISSSGSKIYDVNQYNYIIRYAAGIGQIVYVSTDGTSYGRVLKTDLIQTLNYRHYTEQTSGGN